MLYGRTFMLNNKNLGILFGMRTDSQIIQSNLLGFNKCAPNYLYAPLFCFGQVHVESAGDFSADHRS